MSHPQRPSITVADACALLETTLSGPTRRDILDHLENPGRGTADPVAQLRAAMREHTFRTSHGAVALQRVVKALDRSTRAEGFHVLQSWDFRAHRFSDDTSPVLMLDRYVHARGSPGADRSALAILLDHYFLTLLGLLVLRSWDAEDPNENFDRVTQLLRALNGPGGSDAAFIGDAGLLLLFAISHYHPREHAYDDLLAKVWTLDEAHRVRVALACAASLGSHLRWGFRFMYARDVGRMRDDNIVDYPWLLFSVLTLMRAVDEGGSSRDAALHELLNGLSADPWAFVGQTPTAWRPHETLRDEFRDRFTARGAELLSEFEARRPDPKTYSALGFQCNFLCNALVAMSAMALQGAPPAAPLDALVCVHHQPATDATAIARYAAMLTDYSGAATGSVGAATLVMYDPREAQHSFNTVVRVLGEASVTR
jgi:hypothetical protein